ncbi:hypothetical protein TorRG33x02_296720 [Trema orientale]|uniref:Uncharacterized protein n=1 Tax=Trema orientale TaxID=63057 RepID=A0A2P5C5K6_TREOI|nr:hypothetical protein TorRG33x02_296720 [Trema orientale]
MAYGGGRRRLMENSGRISVQAVTDSSALTSYKRVSNSDGRDFWNELLSDFNLNGSSNSNLNSDSIILGKNSFVCDASNQVHEIAVRKEVIFGPDVSQQVKDGLPTIGLVVVGLEGRRKTTILMDKDDLGPTGVSNKNSDDTLCSNFSRVTTPTSVGFENVFISPPLTSTCFPPPSSTTMLSEVVFNAGSGGSAVKGPKSKH